MFIKGTKPFIQWVVIFLLVFASSSWAQPGKGVEIQPGVLVEANEDRIFLMLPGGAIEAVAISTGVTLWRSEAAAKPVSLGPRRLVAQSETGVPGRLPLTILDPDTGEVLQQREAPLPANVTASIDHGLSSRFELAASSSSDPGQVAWRYRHRVAQGMPGESPVAETELSGQFRVDLQTGQANDLGIRAPQRPNVAIEQPNTTRDPGRRFSSRDSDYTLVSEPLGTTDVMPRYRWTLVDSIGDTIGETEAMVSFSPFTVAGSVLIYVNPAHNTFVNGQENRVEMSVRAVDLSSGSELWVREIRDIRYSGPFPV